MPSRFLPFWPKGAIAFDNSGGTAYGYTAAFQTEESTEVVAQLNFDCAILDPGGGGSITVTPQVSANGKDWADQTAFASVASGSSYPTKEVIKITNVSSFMRFKIALADPMGGGGYSGGTFSIFGVGRWEDVE